MTLVLDPSATQISPEPLYQLVSGFMCTRTLLATHRLGLFEALDGRGQTAADVAKDKGLSVLSTTMLLDACVALKLCAELDGVYRITPLVENYLIKGSPQYMGHFFDHFNDHMYPAWAHLEDAVRTGQGQIHRVIGNHDDQFFQAIDRTDNDLETFMLTMEEHSFLEGDALANAYDFSAHRLLLDVAGGTGAMSAAIVQRYPHIQAIVIERPSACRIAERILRERKMDGKIQVQPGDMFTGPLPLGADICLLSGTLHNWAPRQAETILHQCYQALSPGATLLISEQVLEDEKTGSPIGPLCSLNMLVVMGGREYSRAEYASLLSTTGFRLEEIRQTGGIRQLIVAYRQ